MSEAAQTLISHLLTALLRGEVPQTEVQLLLRTLSDLHLLEAGRYTVTFEQQAAGVVIGDNNTVHVYASAPIGAQPAGDLAEHIRRYLDDLHSSVAGSAGQAPYLGLKAFERQDSERFFGRQAEIAQLAQAVQDAPVVWLHGRSGAGKTSLLQAGLLPALLAQGWLPLLTPLADEAPAALILRALGLPPGEAAPESLAALLGRIQQAAGERRVVLIFDQCEAFWRLCSPEARQALGRQVLLSLQNDTRLRFVFALRSDSYADTFDLRRQFAALDCRELALPMLTREQARQAITGPLPPGWQWQPALLERLLDDLGAADIASPQLQIVCRALYEQAGARQAQTAGPYSISSEDYAALGQAQGILRSYLQQQVSNPATLPPALQPAARYLLTTLVQDDYRIRRSLDEWYQDAHLSELAQAAYAQAQPNGQAAALTLDSQVQKLLRLLPDQAYDLRQVGQGLNTLLRKGFVQEWLIEELLRCLRQARLIQDAPQGEGGPVYELVHDYLVDEVKLWIGTDEQAARQLQQRLHGWRADYERSGRLPGAEDLALVAAQLGNRRLALPPAGRELLLLAGLALNQPQPWYDYLGAAALDFVRTVAADAAIPRPARRGAAALLGQQADLDGFEALYRQCSAGAQPAAGGNQLLAQYLHAAADPPAVPPGLYARLWPHLAALRLRQAEPERRTLRRVAAVAAPACYLGYYAAWALTSGQPLAILLLFALLFSLLIASFGALFAEALIALAVVGRGWRWPLRLALFSLVGLVLGFPPALFISAYPQAWPFGPLVGAALALWPAARPAPLTRRDVLDGLGLALALILALGLNLAPIIESRFDLLVAITSLTAFGLIVVGAWKHLPVLRRFQAQRRA